MLYPPPIADDSDEEVANKITQAYSETQPTFDDLNLSKSILKAVFEAGFQQPTPIQTACIPIALAGRDICACSATGTGKTAAFMLPILERLLFKPQGQKSTTKVLVLVPTRELAIQVFQVSRKLAKYTNVEICLIAGGLDKKTQEAALRQGLDVVIATPGRLIDHLHNSPNFSLSGIEVLVLDEADRILEEQFIEQMKEIIKLCARKRQTMLFSATMTEEVEQLANLSLYNPMKLFVNENVDISLNLHQEFIRIRADRNKKDKEERKREAIVAALVTRDFPDRSIIFMRTKRNCQRMHILLGLLGAEAGQLHSAMTQTKRVETLGAFKRQKNVKILCATDLAARGLDVDGLMTVINMHMPGTLKQYIHRVGRTARAGKAGRSISLVGEDERKLMKEILKINRKGGTPLPLQRTINPEIVDALLAKIGELEASIKRLTQEELFEKQLQQAQQTLKKAEEEVKALGDKKKYQIHERHKGFKADKRNKSDIENQKLRKMSKGRKREEKKNQKLRGLPDRSQIQTKKNIAGENKKTSFTREIADITRETIKRYRHGPDDVEFKKVRREKQKSGIIGSGRK